MSEIPAFQLQRNALGQLAYTGADGVTHEGITPVRAFPLSAPDEGVSLVATTGQELAWLPRLSQVPQAQRALLEAELAGREFMPVIQRLRSVSTFSTPSTWAVDTDRGPATLVLKVEEDIRRLPQRGRLLITSAHGIVFLVHDLTALDRHSKRLLERFL